MANYIDVDKLKAEIERRIALYSSLSENTVNPNRIDEDRQILRFLSTLESEKPMDGLEDEIKRYLREECSDDDEPGIHELAEHFSQWGAEHLANFNDEIVINGHKFAYNKDKDAITMEEIPNTTEELDEAAEKYFIKVPCSEEVKKSLIEIYKPGINAFIAGAKWQKEQMMREAVPFYEILKVVPPGPERDKVRVIIVKEDEK